MCVPMSVLCNRIFIKSHEVLQSNYRNLMYLHHSHEFPKAVKNPLKSYLISTKPIRIFHSHGSLFQSINDSPPGPLTKKQAKELAKKLTTEERDVLITALKECKSQEDKAGFEEQLAAFRWRSKFGRPSKVPTLGDVDPTGSYCTVPEDWLLQKYAQNVPVPSTKDLVLVAIANAIPFIGFGFLDNFIMIVAGDQIEMILNKKFPISTMTAAALGNTVSDVIGIGSVHYVELFAQKIGFQPPKLMPIQLELPKTRFAANVGRVFGVTIGCIIGMTPIPIFALFH